MLHTLDCHSASVGGYLVSGSCSNQSLEEGEGRREREEGEGRRGGGEEGRGERRGGGG